MLNEIYNEDCLETIERMKSRGVYCDVVLTSPPYNSGRSTNSEKSRQGRIARYDVYLDNLSQEDYIDWSCNVLNCLEGVLKENGVIIWNISYGSDQSKKDVGTYWILLGEIIKRTNYTIADRIIWKKDRALPNNTSPNKLTRIVEDVYILVRKSEYSTYVSNKKEVNIGKNGQRYYETIQNYIEARNNDEVCPLNKATFSSDLCKKLLRIYAREGSVVYDCFCGTGTTAIACLDLGLTYIGSEVSSQQCLWAKERIEKHLKDL